MTTPIPQINNDGAYVRVPDGEAPLVFDMNRAGMKTHKVFIMTSTDQVSECLKSFRESPADENKYVFRSILANLGKSYNNLDVIYKNRGITKDWENFTADCVMYCCYRHLYYKADLPILDKQELDAKKIRVELTN